MNLWKCYVDKTVGWMKTMQHIVNVAFDFDDKKITESIESQVHKEVVDNITEEIKKIIYKKNYYGHSYDDRNTEPLRKMVENNISYIMSTHKEEIIEMAANKLADSLKRSKAVKDAVGQVLEDNV